MGAGIRINERGTQREVDEKHTKRGKKRDRKYENGQNPDKEKEERVRSSELGRIWGEMRRYPRD